MYSDVMGATLNMKVWLYKYVMIESHIQLLLKKKGNNVFSIAFFTFASEFG